MMWAGYSQIVRVASLCKGL